MNRHQRSEHYRRATNVILSIMQSCNEETSEEMTIKTVWVSFADRKKFRGVAIVDVDATKDWAGLAIAKTIEMKCNAGPDTSVEMHGLRSCIDSKYKNKLILDEDLLNRLLEEEHAKRIN
jgi:hypothetical protein